MNKLITYLVLIFLSFGTLPKETSEKKLPNVVFIICDDLNDAIEGMGGHPQTITPNLEE